MGGNSGFFGNILGPGGLGLTGQQQNTSQVTQLDPMTQALDALRLGNAQGLNDNYGSLAGSFQNLANTGQLNNDTLGILGSILGLSQQPGMNFNDWYGNSRDAIVNSYNRDRALTDQGYNVGLGNANAAYGTGVDAVNQGYNTGFGNLGLGYDTSANAALQGYQNAVSSANNQYGLSNQQLAQNLGLGFGVAQGNLGTNLDTLASQYGLSREQLGQVLSQGQQGISQYYTGAINSIDPTQALASAKDYYNRVVTPQTSNNYSLLGLGRSGAVGEANAKAGAQLSLPISQQVMAERAGLLGQQGQDLSALFGQYGQGIQGALGQYGAGVQSALGQYGQNQQNALGAYNTGSLASLLQLSQGLQGASGQYTQGLQGAASQYGQGLQGLSSQYSQGLQNFASQYGQQLYGLSNQYNQGLQNAGNQYAQFENALNLAAPGTNANLLNAQLGREQTGLQAADYQRAVQQSTMQNLLQSYLSAYGSIPYNAANTISGLSSGNSGLLGGGSGGGSSTGSSLAGIASLIALL